MQARPGFLVSFGLCVFNWVKSTIFKYHQYQLASLTPTSPQHNTMVKTLKKLSMGDVAEHTSEEDVWITLHGKVYNVTKYMDDHPGECGLAFPVMAHGIDWTLRINVARPWLATSHERSWGRSSVEASFIGAPR